MDCLISRGAITKHLCKMAVQAEVVRWIYDMYISGCGCLAIAKTLNEAGIPNGKGNSWRPNNILQLINNEKYMGDVMMGKSVRIDGAKCDNLDGRYGERYYIENAHEEVLEAGNHTELEQVQQDIITIQEAVLALHKAQQQGSWKKHKNLCPLYRQSS